MIKGPEELRGKVAGLYIDRQILASTQMVRLPDGTMKLEQDLTEADIEMKMEDLLLRHKAISAHDKIDWKGSQAKIKPSKNNSKGKK